MKKYLVDISFKINNDFSQKSESLIKLSDKHNGDLESAGSDFEYRDMQFIFEREQEQKNFVSELSKNVSLMMSMQHIDAYSVERE